ncbi:endocuticle structural glycoprotein SgAbd-4 [Dendroctonus ponderosae]|uniref:Uncharacterized protein n=1 Tax=Dendroctonus ponderosae TaxID=77166 RepID=U4U0F0_DENPD|nr:endocuticle structural glycoprotein SgAbd-4 [Dendroctonus ponderosae]ERL87324.1 hypothetical protein D910_04719 [Dendroctonus ponderosae]KAH1004677.1 hypothetical protein HUJ05_005460 [Dendroctonus ponderosae]KAH1004678.1 hypothetical protein HUJ05_005460 [Dendroctonus ponderosae]
MFVFLISALLVIAPTLSRPQEQQQPTPQQGGSTPIPIVSQSAETKEDGGFSYSFETGNGIKVEESGSVKANPQARSLGNDTDSDVVVLKGSFSYTAPDGQLISVKYVADENGFQPEGDHLPTPPPGLEVALKANLGAQVAQSGTTPPQPDVTV